MTKLIRRTTFSLKTTRAPFFFWRKMAKLLAAGEPNTLAFDIFYGKLLKWYQYHANVESGVGLVPFL
jgi:hypothetical protein